MRATKYPGEGNGWEIGGELIFLPATVQTEQQAVAWWAAHSHELEAGYYPPPPPASPADVHAERDRRLSLGFDFDFGGERGVHRIGTTEADMRGWDEVSKAFQAADRLGLMLSLTIVTDTGPAEVNSTDWAYVLLEAARVRQAIWQASFALQSADPIPEDYADDRHWQSPAE